LPEAFLAGSFVDSERVSRTGETHWPKGCRVCFLANGEINKEILIFLRSGVVASMAAWNGDQIRLLTSFEEILRRDVVPM
jgi:hypothetical protein